MPKAGAGYRYRALPSEMGSGAPGGAGDGNPGWVCEIASYSNGPGTPATCVVTRPDGSTFVKGSVPAGTSDGTYAYVGVG